MSEKKEYIERGALIDFIDAGHLRYATEKVFSENDLVKMISERPAADVEPVVRGEWQKVYENTTFGAMYRCSVCGETTFNVENYKYCPKCGTHMSMERSGSGE